jgi:hypothetical protein
MAALGNITERKERTMNWYRAESVQKNVTQVVLQAAHEQEVAPKFGTLLLTQKFMPLLTNTWATGFFYLDSDPGPFLMVRGDKVASRLKGSPVTAAICFYRMKAGGLVTMYVHVDCPEIAQRLTHPIVLFEIAYGLDDQNSEMKKIIERAIGNESLRICFTEGDGPGEMLPSGGFSSSGIRSQFDVVIPLSADCGAALKKEYQAILSYHANVPASRRDYNASVQQMWAENPQGSNPILSRPVSTTSETAKKKQSTVSPAPSNVTAGGPSKEPIPQPKGQKEDRTRWYHVLVSIILPCVGLLWGIVNLCNNRRKSGLTMVITSVLVIILVLIIGLVGWVLTPAIQPPLISSVR